MASPLDRGVPGRSAAQLADGITAKHERTIRERHPRTAGLRLAITGEPQSAVSWAKGASGERLVGDRLDAVADQGVIALHDRRKPGSRGNIDHLALTPTGVYVIDTKRYGGRIELRNVGGWRHPDERLFVKGCDRTKLALAVIEQAGLVQYALAEAFDGLPVRPVLCFVDAEMGLLVKPFVVRGVHVTWPRRLQKSVSVPGPVAAEVVQAAARHLARVFPPA